MKEYNFNVSLNKAVFFLLKEIAQLKAQLTMQEALLRSFFELRHPDFLPVFERLSEQYPLQADASLRRLLDELATESEEFGDQIRDLLKS